MHAVWRKCGTESVNLPLKTEAHISLKSSSVYSRPCKYFFNNNFPRSKREKIIDVIFLPVFQLFLDLQAFPGYQEYPAVRVNLEETKTEEDIPTYVGTYVRIRIPGCSTEYYMKQLNCTSSSIRKRNKAQKYSNATFFNSMNYGQDVL